MDSFIEKYCKTCGTLLCAGPDDEAYRNGCPYYQNEERMKNAKLYYEHLHNGGDPLASIASIKKEKDGIVFTAKLNEKRYTKTKRLGKFTGTIYNEDYDFSKCPECCNILTDSQANDSAFIEAKKLSNRSTCTFCMGCPASIESKKLDDERTSEEDDSVIADHTYIKCPECGFEIALYTSKGEK